MTAVLFGSAQSSTLVVQAPSSNSGPAMRHAAAMPASLSTLKLVAQLRTWPVGAGDGTPTHPTLL